MPKSPHQYMLANVHKYAASVAHRLITAEEFVNYIIQKFAAQDHVYTQIIPDLWAVIPDESRSAFKEAIRVALLPDFRYPPFHIGGRTMTEEELRQDADLRTLRIKAWAREFVKFLDRPSD